MANLVDTEVNGKLTTKNIIIQSNEINIVSKGASTYNILIGSSSTGEVDNPNTGDKTSYNGPVFDSIGIGLNVNSYAGSIAIGHNASACRNDIEHPGNGLYASGSIAIGTGVKATNGTCIGATGTGSGLVLGVHGTQYVYQSQPSSTLTTTSDRRDKADIKPIKDAKNFILSLSPVTFRDNHRDKYTEKNGKFNQEDYENQTKIGNRRISGFIAQDVYEKMIQYYDDNNYAKIVDYSKFDDPDSDIDRYYMSMTAMIPFIVRAFQEQHSYIKALERNVDNIYNKYISEINELKERIKLLEKNNE